MKQTEGMQYFYCFPDCGRTFSLENGHVEFGKHTTFDQTAAVICDPGYEIQGAADLTCRKDGTWSKSSRCHIKGVVPNVLEYWDA